MIAEEKKIRNAYEQITKTLIARQETITTMESATAGMIASLLTDTEGSSAIFPGAFVTYSNEAKIREGVPREVIAQYSVYSNETAAAMAKACKAAYQTDWGIGVTGTMGNIDPKNPDSSEPGQVYAAISHGAEVAGFFMKLEPQPSRYLYKLAVAEQVAKKLSELLRMDNPSA